MAETESLTLAKALSVKNRLAGRLAQARDNIQSYNSVLAGQREGDGAGAVDVRAEFDRMLKLQDALVAVKAAIQRANIEIYAEILRLGEIKSLIQMLNGLETRHGVEPAYGGAEYRYVAEFRRPEVMDLIRQREGEIDAIQDRINQYNAATRIELRSEVLDLAR